MVLALLHTMVALVAVGVLATSATATAGPTPARADLHNPAEEGRACAMADDPEATVVCGGEFLQRYVDPSMLVMAKDTCTRLLEVLFADSVCILGQERCGQLQPAAPPPLSSLGLVAPAPVTLSGAISDEESADKISRARAADARRPPSWSSRPPSPPPRA
jgi:hypothetical protein